ncbi:hypothetical protein, partial [Paraburkholderia sp. BR14320]|uniref:hypothetical protein n=1 Tax=unclassified Paraburkholderia TaxID=2615204 RepID=UPI0034CDD224
MKLHNAKDLATVGAQIVEGRFRAGVFPHPVRAASAIFALNAGLCDRPLLFAIFGFLLLVPMTSSGPDRST